MHADLSPDRRLHANAGKARALYAELTHNLATRARPDGGALASVVERFITQALSEARTTGVAPETIIQTRLAALEESTGGYDFAHVIARYWQGHDGGDERLKTDAVRWLRGEFSTRADARQSLGVRTIIDDATWYDHVKLMSRFVRMAGYDGLLVCLDEMVNLFKLTNAQAGPSTTSRSCGSSTTACRAPRLTSGSFSAVRRTSCSIPGADCSPIPHWLPGSRRTPSPPTNWSTIPGRYCGWQPVAGGHLCPTDQTASRVRRRRPGRVPHPGRRARRVHATLRVPDR